MTHNFRFLTVPYLLAELLQRSYGADRLKTLQQTRDEYEKFLEALDQYELLSPSNKKLYEQYLEQPESFSLTPTNDASARRQVKITRFKEEKELKQKLEVCLFSAICVLFKEHDGRLVADEGKL